MKWILPVLLMCSFAAGSEIDLPRIARIARPAVRLVVTFDRRGNSIGIGTGFFVAPGGILVTNWHVIKGAARAIVKAEDDSSAQILGILGIDEVHDIAVLQVQGSDFSFLRLGSSVRLEPGARIAVVGCPQALEGTLTDGIVSAIRSVPEMGLNRCIQITAPISPGSSGSPVLDETCEVIGIACFIRIGGQALNFAIPVEFILKIPCISSLSHHAGEETLVKSDTESTEEPDELWAIESEWPSRWKGRAATQRPDRTYIEYSTDKQAQQHANLIANVSLVITRAGKQAYVEIEIERKVVCAFTRELGDAYRNDMKELILSKARALKAKQVRINWGEAEEPKIEMLSVE